MATLNDHGDGGPRNGAVVGDQRQASDELRRYADELERTNRRLEEAHRARDDILAVTSHELRTPLTSILGFSQTLQEHWERLSPEQRVDGLRAIERAGRRLSSMVENMLVMSAAKSGPIEVSDEPVELRPILGEAVARSGLAAEDAVYDCPEDCRVMGDPVRIRHLFVNLADNAAIYGHHPVLLRARRHGTSVVVSVTDSGPGVDEGFVGSLFDNFSQASRGTTRTAQGSGLGLATVRVLAEAMGGTVWYERAEGGGASFVVRLRAV